MVKTRVHDLAAEFGVAPEQLLSMLKDMNIFVRSHMSALESDQVSAVRVRWEREKRKSAEEPAAKKGRRKAAKARSPRRSPVEAKPTKRRRTAAEVAQVEAQAQAEKAAELAALELERPIVRARGAGAQRRPSRSAPAPCSRICRPRPPSRTRTRPRPTRTGQRRTPRTPRHAVRAQHSGACADPGAVHSAAGPAPRRPAARGPKPVFSSSAPAGSVAGPARPARGPALPGRPGSDRAGRRPAAFGPDAEKGGGRKKGKKGKRSSVDQDAVQANILQTLQGMKGRPARKGAPRRRAVVPRGAGRPAGRGEGAREDAASGSTSSSPSPSSPAP